MAMDISQIMEILPHRYPFLMLDRIVSISSDEVVGIKNVTINEPFFQGHFPYEAIMPGVLIIEAMAQAGGILAYSVANLHPSDSVYLMGLDKVRFRKPVRPGDQVVLRVKLLKHKGPVFKMSGEALVADQLVAEGEVLATIDPRKQGDNADA